MESKTSDTNNNNNDTKINTFESSNGLNTNTESIVSDTDSHTEGRPSPSLTTPPQVKTLQPATALQLDSPSATTNGSIGSPTRSKKRAIETMLDGEEDKECIVMEKPPPPLPKRQTPPSSPTKTKAPSPQTTSNLYMSFMDHPLYTLDDHNYLYACKLLGAHRERDRLRLNEDPINIFFDTWVRETKLNAVQVADALFDMLLVSYDPATDERLLSRIPVIVNQIVQKKRKETVAQLFRIIHLAVQLTLKYLENVVVGVDDAKVKGSLDFLKTINAFCFQATSATPPRAFSGYAFDKTPYGEKMLALRIVLLGHFCKPAVYARFTKLVKDYSVLNNNEHSVLSMMTLVGEVALSAFRCYKSLKAVARVKERLRFALELGTEADLKENFDNVMHHMRELGQFMHSHLTTLIRTERNTSVLSVAQLSMTSGFLRSVALYVGALDMGLPTAVLDPLQSAINAMQMSARLAFEGFTTETKRQDLLDWSVNWVKRQMELDYGKNFRDVAEAEPVGPIGITYLGELFRDRKLLDYLTVDRISSNTLQNGLLFFLFALKNIGALAPEDLDTLYTRYVVECDQEVYWRAWWDGLRQVLINLDTVALRNTLLAQIRRTPWKRSYFQPDISPNNVTMLVGSVVDAAKDQTAAMAAPIPGWDCMPAIITARYLLRAGSIQDVDDSLYRSNITDVLYRLFPFYPATGAERYALAEECYINASTVAMDERLGDLQILRTLVMADTADYITEWKREECVHRLCMLKPSLPEVILEELSGWKQRQYLSGLENEERTSLIQVRVQFLMLILGIERNFVDGFRFPREVLEYFWDTALMKMGERNEERYWGGDVVTELMRSMFFHNISAVDLRRHPGLDVEFFRFFIDEKFPNVNMEAIKTGGWDFVVKGIEFLDSQLGLDYISTPRPLLWKIIRESQYCSPFAMKIMTLRLLKPNVPSSVHEEFVNSTIDEVIAIGKKPRKTVDGKMSERDYQSFRRTFDTLSLFLNEYRISVHEKGDEEMQTASPETMEVEGEKKMITARCTQSPGPKDYRDFHFSPETTIKEFLATLASKLSIIRFRVFAQGREVSRKEADQMKTLHEWGFKDLEAIMIQVQERIKEEPLTGKISAAETWVSSRFSELHALLSGDLQLAFFASRFLISLPPQPMFVDKLRNLETPWEELFSDVFPWELYYSVYALQACLGAYKRDDPAVQWLVAFGEQRHEKIIDLIVWLSSPPFTTSNDWACSVPFAIAIIDGYFHRDIDAPWKQSLPMERLINALFQILRHQGQHNSYITLPVLKIIFTLASFDSALWLNIVSPVFESYFFPLAVECQTESIRDTAWTCFLAFFDMTCQSAFAAANSNGEHSDSDNENKMDIDRKPTHTRDKVLLLWDVAMNCMTRAHKYIPNAAKAFETGANMLRIYYRALASVQPEEAIELLGAVSDLAQDQLSAHTVTEDILVGTVDYITLGWTRILQAVLDLSPPEELSTLVPRDFSKQLFTNFLFPPLPSDDPEFAEPMIPYCIQSETRGALFDVIFKLSNTQNKRNLIASFLKELIEEDSDIFPDDHYIDRSLWLQAPSRLTGIHNLSNTCYMNSLVNQLFMNFDFRNFLYSVEVNDPEVSQTLLHQLQYLFARLQLGNDKAAFPQELAQAIIDFEGQPINIHIQMDVDEFFNLLFDRIESQFKNIEERSQFRQLYGGVLCHTIKSKECPHVSSREEDFTAIQCDVRGKRTLEESLASYVKGEVMDGDNKYSCEACGRHVDAVKQISIKSLPNNLIFHLKRFEYAVDIGKRIKVNDYFAFPRSIDLFPYTIANIEMQEKGINLPREQTEEIYDLVGVLVHTGTAESGHYYSYIKDPRPQEGIPQEQAQWYEFNDSDVKPWRVEELDHWCFGGQELSYDPAYYPEPPSKSYSAYMLFYRKRPKSIKMSLTLETQLPPPDVKLKVQRYNDDFVRKYVLYGEDLSAFVVKLLRSMPQSEVSQLENCEINALDNHSVDLYPLDLGLQVYRYIVCRMEFRSSVEKFGQSLKAAIRSSPAARHFFYAWLQKTPGCLKELLLTNVNEKARTQSAHIIASALISDEVAKPRRHNPEDGIHLLDIEVIRSVLGDLASLVYTAGDNWRSWSEYFETLALIARDPDWARLLISENMLLNSAYHFVHTHMIRRTPPTGFARLKYPDNDRVRPSYRKVVALMAQLIPHLMVPVDNPNDDRRFVSLDEPGSIIDDEWNMLFLEWEAEIPILGARRAPINIFVHRLFETSCDVPDISVLVKWMLMEAILRDNLNNQKMAICNTLFRQLDPTGMNAADALEVIAALFEHNIEMEEDIVNWHALLVFIIKRVGLWSDYLRESFFVQEYLKFWKLVYEYDDERYPAIAIAYLPAIASHLLYCNEANVREQTAIWVQEIITKFVEEDIASEPAALTCMNTLYIKLVWLTDNYLERKILVTERSTTIESIVTPVLQILRLIAMSCPIAKDNNPEGTIERLQERAKEEQSLQDSNFYYADASDEDMEDMETDDESVVEGSPFH